MSRLTINELNSSMKIHLQCPKLTRAALAGCNPPFMHWASLQAWCFVMTDIQCWSINPPLPCTAH